MVFEKVIIILDKMAVQQDKLSMIIHMLETQKTEEVREQKVLNYEPTVHNEIKDLERQPTEPMMPPLNENCRNVTTLTGFPCYLGTSVRKC